MHVPPAGGDVAEELVTSHGLSLVDDRHDVPVAVHRRAATLDDGDVLGALDVDGSSLDCIDGRPVRPGDVNAGVERLRAVLPDTRIAEESPHRVLTINRDQRPAVAHS